MVLERAVLERPIREDDPSGEWLRRDDVYSEVREAMRSVAGDPDYGIEEKRPDWTAVVRICEDALSNRTKDLHLAICLLEAAAATEGTLGVADGIWLIRTLHERFWDDFHPRPRDRDNLDGRLNQLDALVRDFARIIDAVPLSDGPDRITYFDWRHADGRLPNGEPSPWSSERRRRAVFDASWESLDQARTAANEAREHLRGLDDVVDGRYGERAPSLSEIGGLLEDLEAALGRALSDRGPGPHVQEASEILAQTGCSFLDVDWLAERIRSGLPTSRAINSLSAAVADELAGTRPEGEWAVALEAVWATGQAYARRNEDSSADQPPSDSEAPAPSPAPTVTDAPPPVPVRGAVTTQTVLQTCRALAASEPGNPVAYTVPRFVSWTAAMRAADGGGFPAPPAGSRERLPALFEAGRWAELLEQSESLATSECGPYWLDLQRYTCAAMGEIGAPYADCRDEVIRFLGEHLRRHSWLVEATLGDGEPAADDVTRNWIREEVQPTGSSTSVHAEAEGASAQQTNGLAEALDLLEGEGFEIAVDRLQARVEDARSGRSRARAALDLGELCLVADRPDLAAPILERVRRDLLADEIARWESSEFRQRSLTNLYRAYDRLASQDPGGGHEGRLRDLAEEIAQIDLSLRLRLEASQP